MQITCDVIDPGKMHSIITVKARRVVTRNGILCGAKKVDGIFFTCDLIFGDDGYKELSNLQIFKFTIADKPHRLQKEVIVLNLFCITGVQITNSPTIT